MGYTKIRKEAKRGKKKRKEDAFEQKEAKRGKKQQATSKNIKCTGK